MISDSGLLFWTTLYKELTNKSAMEQELGNKVLPYWPTRRRNFSVVLCC